MTHVNKVPLDAAGEVFSEVLEVTKAKGVKEPVAQALFGLAHVEQAHGNRVEAYRLSQDSLAIFESIGHYQTAEVREWLTNLS